MLISASLGGLVGAIGAIYRRGMTLGCRRRDVLEKIEERAPDHGSEL
jgi:hypothetical protein